MKDKDKAKLDAKATFLAGKARELRAEGKRTKAIQHHVKAADLFEEIAAVDKDAWPFVEENLIATAKLLLEEEDFQPAARAQRRIANIKIVGSDFPAASEYYNVATKYALKGRKVDDALALQLASMHCVLVYLGGEQEKARDFMRKVLGQFVPDEASPVHAYLRALFKAIVPGKVPAIPFIPDAMARAGMTRHEIDIMDLAARLRRFEAATVATLELRGKGGDEFMEADDIVATLAVSVPVDDRLALLAAGARVTSIVVEKSNDLAIVSRFPTTADIPFGTAVTLVETFRSYYPGRNEIGPVSLVIAVGPFTIKRKIDPVAFVVSGQPANMVVTFEKLQEPLIGKPFPLRIDITNDGRGNASNIDVEMIIDDESPVQVVRGTMKKRISSLARGESTSWDLMLRPAEEGTFDVTVSITYKDADGRDTGPELHAVPIEIKM